MLDCISGGRLVAGLPLGSPMDVNLCYGITPMEQRERYREAFALTLKAWQSREMFAWNGRYYPARQREPVAAARSSSRIRRCGCRARAASAPSTSPSSNDACYCFLSYSGARSAKTMMDGYWEVVDEEGARAEPVPRGLPPARRRGGDRRRAPRPSTPGTSSTSITSACTCPRRTFAPPGNQDYRSLRRHRCGNPVRRAGESQGPALPRLRRQGLRHRRQPGHRARPAEGRSRQGPARGQPDGAPADRLHAPRADAREHRPVRARGAARTCADIWDDEGWVNHWWPERLRGRGAGAARRPASAAGGA